MAGKKHTNRVRHKPADRAGKHKAQKRAKKALLLQEGHSQEWISKKLRLDGYVNMEACARRGCAKSYARLQSAKEHYEGLGTKLATQKEVVYAQQRIAGRTMDIQAANTRLLEAQQKVHKGSLLLAATEAKEAPSQRQEQQQDLPQEMEIDNKDLYTNGIPNQSLANHAMKESNNAARITNRKQAQNSIPRNVVFHFLLSNEALGAVPVTIDQCCNLFPFFEHAMAAWNVSGGGSQADTMAAVSVTVDGISRPMVLPWGNHQAFDRMLETVGKVQAGRIGDLNVDVRCIKA